MQHTGNPDAGLPELRRSIASSGEPGCAPTQRCPGGELSPQSKQERRRRGREAFVGAGGGRWSLSRSPRNDHCSGYHAIETSALARAAVPPSHTKPVIAGGRAPNRYRIKTAATRNLVSNRFAAPRANKCNGGASVNNQSAMTRMTMVLHILKIKQICRFVYDQCKLARAYNLILRRLNATHYR